MKNTTATTKPAVTIGSTVCYRNKSGGFSLATVKDIVDSEYGKMAVMTFINKDNETVEFQKLLKNVWVYTGKKNAEPAEPALAAGDEVFYIAKSGKPAIATVVSVEDDIVTIKCKFGGKLVQRDIADLYRNREDCKATLAA